MHSAGVKLPNMCLAIFSRTRSAITLNTRINRDMYLINNAEYSETLRHNGLKDDNKMARRAESKSKQKAVPRPSSAVSYFNLTYLYLTTHYCCCAVVLCVIVLLCVVCVVYSCSLFDFAIIRKRPVN